MASANEAELYDAMDHSEANEAFLMRLFQLGAGGRMLDLGTGPGHIPLTAVVMDRECRIVATDLSEPMLAIAEEHRAISNHGDRVEFRKADVADLSDEPDGAFDTVWSNSVLHHVSDPVAFLKEARRLCRAGGVLLIRDLRRPETEQEAMQLVAQHASDEPKQARNLFYASLLAAYTTAELSAFAKAAGWVGASVKKEGDRHLVLEVLAAD
jgi:ubiquinone/menaquinone biosynthesis C-methylase UbiE